MCGIEKAGFEQDSEGMERAIRMDVMLHAYMFMQSGIPVLYSGDEIAQVNDYTYKDEPDKAADSRYIHRGAMNWTLAENISKPDTVEGKMFAQLGQLERIRKSEKVFETNADMRTIDTGDVAVLCIARHFAGDEVVGLFNFSEHEKTIRMDAYGGKFVDMIMGDAQTLSEIHIPAYGFCYLKRKPEKK